MNDIFENTETMQENEHPRFYTAESVMRGHPDKLCDLIADNVLDECLKHDPASRVACEVMATHGHIIVAGEITTSAKPDVFNIVRDTLRDIGYDPKAYQIDCYIHDQSPDIAGAVEPELAEGEDEDTLGAGDQGVMVGYACNETPEYLPMPVVAAQRLVTLLEISRMTDVIPDIGPDGKVQVTMEYDDDIPVRITTVVISVQHTKNSEVYMKLNHNKKSVKISLNLFALYAVLVCGIVFALPTFAADDPLVVVENLSTFIFSLIRAVGLILLGWGIVQVGLSLQSHDPSQRSQGFLTLAGGLVITFAKEILDLITA